MSTTNNVVYEVNFDGLIGPTHNYSGLSYGNLASLASRHQASSPKQAALQGLAKMKLLHSLGIKQAIIPPQERPDLDGLRAKGFQGSDAEILERAFNSDKEYFLSCCSASSMWCANAATAAPSWDTKDGKVHISAANLTTHPHRAQETKQTTQFLKSIFAGDVFIVHEPLSANQYRDEGAANHMRLAAKHALKGVNIFVYGKEEAGQKYPSRQSLEASTQIAKQHGLDESLTIFAQQNPEAIARGVFHNDVIASGNEGVLLVHEQAFVNQSRVLAEIKFVYKQLTKKDLIIIETAQQQLSIEEAVSSYLFNSQIVTLQNGKMTIIAPVESEEGRPRAIIDEIIKHDNPVTDAVFVDLRQSMANGGGPACLRLRVVVNPRELSQIHQGYLLDDQKFGLLEDWINRHYREQLAMEDLKSAALLDESRRALDALTVLLQIGKIYSFQSNQP